MRPISIRSMVSVLAMVVISLSVVISSTWAFERKLNPSKSSIKARGSEVQERAVSRWESLTPDEQEYLSKIAKERADQASMTAEEYWNSLSEEEQRELSDKYTEGAKNRAKRWKNLPE